MKPFEYFEPRTVMEATELLSTYGGKARILAGGIDLIPRMRKGEIKAGCVVNIQNIPGLEHIETNEKGEMTFGAMARLRSIEASETIQNKYPITPGMIMMAKALLDENPNPSRQEVKEGLGGNLCRCTGYVKIIDAAMAAAEVMGKGGR
jgi:xanthine dehydrogenase iron-sulfur cluster and FAD-binding subunit A